MSFEQLGLNPAILKAVADSGYLEATPIQAQAIPEILAGHDVMASAQTGTGKTAAFILPALNKLAEPSQVKSRGPRVLVLTPTRELATQVTDAAAKYGKYLKRVKTISILGGMPYPLQIKLLSQPVEILVATPGRLLDHMNSGRIDFSRLEMLILDEADRMLDMGFIDDVETIASALPANHQTLLFSATLDGAIGHVAQRILKDPKTIRVAGQKVRHENIEQRLHLVDDLQHKNKLLTHLLTDVAINQAIVFTATRRDADQIAEDLYEQGHSAAALHGDMTQRERNRTLTGLRRGQLRVLVATDVAARGIDVNGISHVINFDLPKAAEDYVHRIGRTGRAGNSGIAVSFAGKQDLFTLKRIERYTGHPITQHVVAGLEPRLKLEKPTRRKPGFGGKPRFGDKPFGDKPRFGDKPGYGGHGKPAFGHKTPGERRTENHGQFHDRSAAPHSHGKPAYGDKPAFGHGRDSAGQSHWSDRKGNSISAPREQRSGKPGFGGHASKPQGNRRNDHASEWSSGGYSKGRGNR